VPRTSISILTASVAAVEFPPFSASSINKDGDDATPTAVLLAIVGGRKDNARFANDVPPRTHAATRIKDTLRFMVLKSVGHEFD
jgi:hypothetical protein